MPGHAWDGNPERGDQIFNFDYVDYEPGWFSSRDGKVMAKELGRGDAEKAFPKPKYKYLRDESDHASGLGRLCSRHRGRGRRGGDDAHLYRKGPLAPSAGDCERRCKQGCRQPLPRFP